MFICSNHRNVLVKAVSPESGCTVCNKKRSGSSPTAKTFMTITYAMSLSHHMTSGRILPIGQLVCIQCKDKHLKGVDCSNSQVVSWPCEAPEQESPKPTSDASSTASSSVGESIFAKIGRLNEALQAINPRTKPIGFSITSIDSCSESVLRDATSAAETAVQTLMSVIGNHYC